MEKQKRYAELKARLESYEGKNAEIAAKIKALDANQEALRERALRAEVLGESGWKEKKDEAERDSERLRRLEDDKVTGEKAVGILREELEKLTNDVAEELRAQFRPTLEKALKAYVAKIQEAITAEDKVREVIREGDAAVSQLGIHRNLGLEYSGSAIIGLGERLLPGIVERCKLNGLNVE